LPWTCDRCKLKFCEDHRTYDLHQCSVAAPTPKITTSTNSNSRPNTFHSLTCHKKDCKTVLNTTTSPATRCVCGNLFCLNHRHPSDHACPGAPPKKSALLSSSSTTMTKETLLSKLKEWSSNRKSSENEKSKGSLIKSLIRTKSNQANSTVVQRGLELGRLRREAKGDTKIAEDKRIYVYGEGPPNLTASLTNAAQVLRKPVYFSKVCSFT
jgi:AN1-type zinc finger protein 1